MVFRVEIEIESAEASVQGRSRDHDHYYSAYICTGFIKRNNGFILEYYDYRSLLKLKQSRGAYGKVARDFPKRERLPDSLSKISYWDAYILPRNRHSDSVPE